MSFVSVSSAFCSATSSSSSRCSKWSSMRSCLSSGQFVLFDASVISIYFMINLRKKLRRLKQILTRYIQIYIFYCKLFITP